MRPSPLRFVVLLCALACPATAGAAERAKVPKMAALDVKAVGKVEAKDVVALSSLIAAEAGRYPLKVVSGADLQTLLGFERQKQLMGCSDGSCLVEIGGALGVDYLLATEIGQVGSRYLLTVTLLDVARATALGRVSQPVATLNDLIDAVGGAVAQVFGDRFGAARPASQAKAPDPAKAPETKAPEAAKAPDAAVAAPASGGASGQRIAGYALLAGGAALLVGGGICGGLAYAEYSSAMSAGTPSQSQYEQTTSSIKTLSAAADGLLAAGVVAAGVGLVVALTAPSSAPTVTVAPIAGGGAVVVGGEF